MRIFYIHQYFKTPEEGGAIRSWYLSRALAEQGIQVEVITAHSEKRYEKKEVDGVTVHYLFVPYDNGYGFIRRIRAFVTFVNRAVKLMRQMDSPDLCYASSTPLTVGLIARWLKKHRKVPYYFEVRDLWPQAPVEMGYFRDPLSRGIVRYMEKWIYNGAEKIICLSPGIQERIRKIVPGKEVDLIPNMSDTNYFKPARHKANFSQRTLTVSYFGALGPVNHLEFLLGAAEASLHLHLPLHFNIAGTGSRLKALKRIAKEKQLSNVTFVGFLDRAGVRELLENTDIVYVSFKNIPVLETNSPNKFFDALAAGKMCVVNTKGWIADLLEVNQAGFYTDPLNPHDFIHKIKPFIQNPSLLEKYQQNARLLAVEKFSRGALSKAFCQIITGKKQTMKVNKELAYILNP